MILPSVTISVYRAVAVTDSFDAREEYTTVASGVNAHLNTASAGMTYTPDGAKVMKSTVMISDACDILAGDLIRTSNNEVYRVEGVAQATSHLLPYTKSFLSRVERAW